MYFGFGKNTTNLFTGFFAPLSSIDVRKFTSPHFYMATEEDVTSREFFEACFKQFVCLHVDAVNGA